MNKMNLNELIEFLIDAREKGVSGETPVAVMRGSYFRRITPDIIRSRRASKQDFDSGRTSVAEVKSRGVELLVIG